MNQTNQIDQRNQITRQTGFAPHVRIIEVLACQDSFPQPASAEVVPLIVRLPSNASNDARALPSPLCCRLRLLVMIRASSCYAPGTEDSNLDPCPVFGVHITLLAKKKNRAR